MVRVPPSLTLRRATCGARSKRGQAQTRLRLKQVPALIRFGLRSSARPDGLEGRNQCGEDCARSAQAKPVPEFELNPIPHPFCMRRGAEVQTDQGWRVSERSEFSQTPAGPRTAGFPSQR